MPLAISRREFLTLSVAGTVLAGAANLGAAGQSPGPPRKKTLVELYTSQG